jgi:hypothetical protein
MAAEEVTLETDKLAEFLGKVEDWRNDWNIGECAVYRGHTDFNWILIAKLFRDPDAKPVNRESDAPHQVEEQLLKEHLPRKEAHALECRLLDEFSRYLYEHRPDLVYTVPQEEKSSNTRAMQEWRQLAIAQHYGLPTRFLDFTTNMLVALFFAVEEPAARRKTTNGEWEEQDSAVWCIEVPKRLKVWEVWKEKEAGVWLSPPEFAEEDSDRPIIHFENTAFVPEHIDERIRAQGSVFMTEPRGKKSDWTLHVKLRDKEEIVLETVEKKTKTRKVRIPTDFRESLREQLDLVGINRATLFPDLASAARYLAWAVHQRRRP